MQPHPHREVTLYVRSKKTVTSFYRASPVSAEATSGGSVVAPSGGAPSAGANPDLAGTETGFMLSDDQAHAVALVQEIAPHRGYAVKIVDVARTNLLRQLMDGTLRGVEHFPVLDVEHTRRRLEGAENFTWQNLLNVLPAELGHLRAFTYLKVKAVETEQVRVQLIAFDEVKETHLVAGDWDLFLVLDFANVPGTSKRAVLDFVINKISRIPGVEDTSTLIPEYSVTKFPL
jgi:DNA-binding Lrp family transcriptional regulator